MSGSVALGMSGRREEEEEEVREKRYEIPIGKRVPNDGSRGNRVALIHWLKI